MTKRYDKYSDHKFELRRNYARMARKLLILWERDGEPDVEFIDDDDVTKGTWIDFWREVSIMDQKEASELPAADVRYKNTR